MEMDRRALLKSSLLLAGGLALPAWSIGKELTDVDHIILNKVTDLKRQVTGIEVDRRLYNKMSLHYFDDVKVSPIDQETGEDGYISYYRIRYGEESITRYVSPDLMDWWVSKEIARLRSL